MSLESDIRQGRSYDSCLLYDGYSTLMRRSVLCTSFVPRWLSSRNAAARHKSCSAILIEQSRSCKKMCRYDIQDIKSFSGGNSENVHGFFHSLRNSVTYPNNNLPTRRTRGTSGIKPRSTVVAAVDSELESRTSGNYLFAVRQYSRIVSSDR